MLALIFTAVEVDSVKEVVVEGVAAYEKGNEDVARDKAIKDALRKAVEQAVGVFISSETIVENYDVLSDRIFSKSSGYVSSYAVLREKVHDGLYRVLVRAKVKLGDVRNDLEAIGILLEMRGRPRVMVLIKDEDVRSMVEEKLLSLNFPLVDYSMVVRNTEKDVLDAALEGDMKTARKIAMNNGAEVYILGSVETKEGKYRGKETYRVTLRLKAVETSTSGILSSAFVNRKLPFDEMEAKKVAVEEAVDKLTKDVLSKWKVGVIVLLKVKGIPSERVNWLKQELYDRVRGIRAIYERESYGNYVVLELSTETSPQDVLDDVRRIKHLKVSGFEGQTIRATFESRK